MSGARKFAFDTEFAPNGAILSDGPKRLTPEEVDAERAGAYEHGKHDAVAQAERQSAAALEALANAASAILTRLDTESRAMRTDAARVALAAARKISGAALDSFGEDRAAAAIDAAMDTLRHNPRLVVKLAPDAVENLKPRIDAMCESHGYTGAILVRAEPNLRAGDVVIDWSDGVISSSAEDTAARIETLIDTALAAASPA